MQSNTAGRLIPVKMTAKIARCIKMKGTVFIPSFLSIFWLAACVVLGSVVMVEVDIIRLDTRFLVTPES